MSMTGYGRAEANGFSVEIKTVNHRFSDISVKLPKTLSPIEENVKRTIRQSITRGKADVFINRVTQNEEEFSVKINEELANSLSTAFRTLCDQYGFVGKDTLSLATRFPDVITLEKQTQADDEIWRDLKPALDAAAQSLLEMRKREGENLKKDLALKLNEAKSRLSDIESVAPTVAQSYRQRLEKRLKEILADNMPDEARLLQEVAIFAEKSCIDEEITRLKSHIAQMEEILNVGGAVGRKFDFIAQEMNRETNTIASKSAGIEITNITIELKSVIEKIREQVQNIE